MTQARAWHAVFADVVIEGCRIRDWIIDTAIARRRRRAEVHGELRAPEVNLLGQRSGRR